LTRPEKNHSREFPRQTVPCRPVADNDLGARQVKFQERLEVFLHREAADRQKDGARKIQAGLCARPEKLGIDAARP